MFEAVKKLMFGDREEGETSSPFSADDKQVAEAALMFHIIAVDGTVTGDERAKLAGVLSRQFDLTDAQVATLMEEAQRADREAVDLYAFTRILKVELTRDERLTLIGNLWEMVFADGVVHEFEDNIVWRVAELLDIDSRDRMELKKKIGARAAGP